MRSWTSLVLTIPEVLPNRFCFSLLRRSSFSKLQSCSDEQQHLLHCAVAERAPVTSSFIKVVSAFFSCTWANVLSTGLRRVWQVWSCTSRMRKYNLQTRETGALGMATRWWSSLYSPERFWSLSICSEWGFLFLHFLFYLFQVILVPKANIDQPQRGHDEIAEAVWYQNRVECSCNCFMRCRRTGSIYVKVKKHERLRSSEKGFSLFWVGGNDYKGARFESSRAFFMVGGLGFYPYYLCSLHPT